MISETPKSNFSKVKKFDNKYYHVDNKDNNIA